MRLLLDTVLNALPTWLRLPAIATQISALADGPALGSAPGPQRV
jgi:hypothetical protein